MKSYIKTMREKIGHETLIMVGAGVLVYKDSKVLLQKRKDNFCWGLHGGAIEIGEKVEDAAARELFEETGLKAKKLELLGVYSGENMLHTYPNGDKVYIISIIYMCNDFSGKLLIETDETSGLEWFGIDNLPKNINPTDSGPIKAFVEYIKLAE